MERTRNLRIDALALLVCLASVFLAISLMSYDPADPPTVYVHPANEKVQNLCGSVGARVSTVLVEILGIGSLVICLIGIDLAWKIFRRRPTSKLVWNMVGYLLVLLSVVALLDRIGPITHLVLVAGPGGSLGAVLFHWMEGSISAFTTYIVIFTFFSAGVLLAFAQNLGLVLGLLRRSPERSGVCTTRHEDAGGALHTPYETPKIPPRDLRPRRWEEFSENHRSERYREHPRQEPKIVRNGFDGLAPVAELPQPVSDSFSFQLPDLLLLDDPETFDFGNHEQHIRQQAELMERTFEQFRMKVKVVRIDTGPVLTQYEIELEPGLHARRVLAMVDDLSIALSSPRVRIVAPIPGKNTVGIEVPNQQRVKVTLKEVMGMVPASSEKMRLPLYLGKDIRGQPLVFDLANMPHLLIAGRTGTGKSVCLNSLILSLLITQSPERVKMLLIDPKMVELSPYNDIPHLLHPVVTEMKQAEALLAWAVDKMEERYDLLTRIGVRHIDSYNQLSTAQRTVRLGRIDEDEKERIPEQMPYILIFADEMADLMMTAAKEVEGYIIRLAQKSRAVGIHLVLATQKPTVDVITGLIKSNLPARIAFQVASRSDSRVVLDEMGAEKLLGFGDMLFLYPGTSKLIRAQGTFVSDEEVHRVVGYLTSQAGPQYSKELIELGANSSAGEGGLPRKLSDRDELYEQAIDIVVHEHRGSVSLLQRALGIGYGRGARLIDYMACDGIVGAYNGSQAREVLYTSEQWERLKQERWDKGEGMRRKGEEAKIVNYEL